MLLHNLHTGRYYLPDAQAHFSLGGGSLKAFMQAVAAPPPPVAHIVPADWRTRCAGDRSDRQSLAPTLAGCPHIDYLGLPPHLAGDTLVVVPLPATAAYAKTLNTLLTERLPRDYPYALTVHRAATPVGGRYQLRIGSLDYTYVVYISGILQRGDDSSYFLFIEDRETGLRYAPAPMPVTALRADLFFLRALR
ncbi:MAG: hypothetical protein OHK0039_48220 [Bacteroidia bacterium]